MLLQKQECRVKKMYTLQKSQHSVLKNVSSNLFVSDVTDEEITRNVF